MTGARGERGFVLAGIVVVLIVAAALLGAAFFHALQEERLGRAARDAQRALAAAEAGAWAGVRQVDAALIAGLPPGASRVLPVTLPEGAGSAVVAVHAWGEKLMLVGASGIDPSRSAGRDVALLIRLEEPPLALPGVLAAADAVAPEVAAAVDAADRVPEGWQCPPSTGHHSASVAAPWTEQWSDWDSLAARAAVAGGLPSIARPVVIAPGGIALLGGSGTGILLVDGDATLDGGAKLTGALLVRGTLMFRGAGGQVVGAVRAGRVVADPTALSGAPLVLWSSCAVARALRAAAAPRVASGWKWYDLNGGW